ncbi:hypothetical protein DXG01_011469 [Tephrocybe rancida]|nr:hypothetical protein DXG01_011469 [Tephrocybe rancida]
MATPHCASEDFEYKGMFIPKDTVVVLNCYTLHHNEERYPNAYVILHIMTRGQRLIVSVLMHFSEVFNPDRFLGDTLSCGESAKLPNVMDRDHWTFGAGRRICPGLPAAERELWLAISRLLWAFTFHSVPGEPISLEEYDGLSGRTPKPFRLQLSPRVEKLDEFLQSKEEITMAF